MKYLRTTVLGVVATLMLFAGPAYAAESPSLSERQAEMAEQIQAMRTKILENLTERREQLELQLARMRVEMQEAEVRNEGSEGDLNSVTLTIPEPRTTLPALETSEPQTETTRPSIEAGSGASASELELTPASDRTYIEAVVEEIHTLTNEARERAGVPPLEYDEDLANIATGHSEDMLAEDYFAHESPDGCDLACRYDEASYSFAAAGENIAWAELGQMRPPAELADIMVTGWLESDGHRRNMLDRDFTHEGVGVAQDGNTFYATANFAEPL